MEIGLKGREVDGELDDRRSVAPELKRQRAPRYRGQTRGRDEQRCRSELDDGPLGEFSESSESKVHETYGPDAPEGLAPPATGSPQSTQSLAGT